MDDMERRPMRMYNDEHERGPGQLEESPMSISLKYSNLIIFGLVLIFIGLFLSNLLVVINDPSYDLYKWFTFFRQLFWFGGTILIAGAMMMNGLKKTEMKPAVRVAMIIGGVAILVFMLSNAPTNTTVNLDLQDWLSRYG